MKVKTILITLALCFAATTAVMAKTNPHMGTWKLNETKSRISPGAAKNHTVVYEVAGDDIKVIVDGTDGEGNPIHNEWTGKFDGKYHSVTGDPAAEERSYKLTNTRTLVITGRMGGKVTLSGRIVVSMNGKMRTVTVNTTDANGKRFRTVAVYDKE